MFCLLAPEADVRAYMAPCHGWLTTSEQARLSSLGTQARRDTFLAGRWLARHAVQRWLGAGSPPALDVADSGACHVAGRRDVFVSISHGAGHIFCAAAGMPVGADVESLARQRDHLAIAEAVHSPTQRRQLAALPLEGRGLHFLQAWTLKEAWLKAREQGLDFARMRALDFDDDPQGDVAVATVGDLVLAVAGHPTLPAQIEGPLNAVWRRCQARMSAP